MMSFLIMVFISNLIVGFWVFISNRKHLMNMLISMEYIVLSLFFAIFLVVMSLGLEAFVLLMFLVASVCEGSLGLSLMVGIVRSHGNDEINSFNVLSC
uniref:NADH-ubiquinone oxidoreductase chain 4L n=1 Tax=Altiverruca navicula TaxID=2099647 RepID=A0A343UTF0_9CRUS|nr:NADH dehydrogenase subunit 4L [Altiverruca navicula]AVI15458.1 NADH dehydrogenase subunit 4L [Altiverruca navicula]